MPLFSHFVEKLDKVTEDKPCFSTKCENRGIKSCIFVNLFNVKNVPNYLYTVGDWLNSFKLVKCVDFCYEILLGTARNGSLPLLFMLVMSCTNTKTGF